MGNVCCQTDVNTNALQNQILQIDEYQDAQLPTNDQVMNEWLASSQLSLPSGDIQSDMPIKTMRQINGERYYVGAWRKGVPEGKGFIYEPKKILFLGDFKNGVPQGKSSINFVEERIQFHGDLKDGKANGNGTIDNLQHKFRFTGEWQDSKPKRGTLTLSSDPNISTIEINDYSNGDAIISYKDNRRYEGTINTTKLYPHGRGKVTFVNHEKKAFYEGDWHNGLMHGSGKFTWKDGSVYEGDFIQGRKEGEGKFTFPNGNYYEGCWIGGKQNGVGRLFNKKNLQLKKGLWKDGVFQNSLDEESLKNESKIYQEKVSTSKKEAQQFFRKEEEQERVESEIKHQNSLSSNKLKKKDEDEDEYRFRIQKVEPEEKKSQASYYGNY